MRINKNLNSSLKWGTAMKPSYKIYLAIFAVFSLFFIAGYLNAFDYGQCNFRPPPPDITKSELLACSDNWCPFRPEPPDEIKEKPGVDWLDRHLALSFHHQNPACLSAPACGLFISPLTHPKLSTPSPCYTPATSPHHPRTLDTNQFPCYTQKHRLSRMSIQSYNRLLKPIYNIPWSRRGRLLDRKIERCPYCRSRGLVKRGRRQTKHESIQLYLCKDYRKTFSPRIIKHKQYPLKVILDAVSFYNLGHRPISAHRKQKSIEI